MKCSFQSSMCRIKKKHSYIMRTTVSCQKNVNLWLDRSRRPEGVRRCASEGFWDTTARVWGCSETVWKHLPVENDHTCWKNTVSKTGCSVFFFLTGMSKKQLHWFGARYEENTINIARGALEQSFIQTLYDTQPKIMEVIIEKRGESTKYWNE